MTDPTATDHALRLHETLKEIPEGHAFTYDIRPGDDRTIVALDVPAPNRWWWRVHTTIRLLVAALTAGMVIDRPPDGRTVVVLDVSTPGRWRWRLYATGWLLVAAFGAGMAVASLIWAVTG